MIFNRIMDEDFERVYQANDSIKELFSNSILITGCYGMLASYFVSFLIYLNEVKGANVSIFAQGRDIEKMRVRFGLYFEKSYFHPITKSIEVPFYLDESMDYIVHAASLASPNYYSTIPMDVLKPNTIGTYYLLEYARKCKLKKFLFFSSSEVYGEEMSKLEKITIDTFSGNNPMHLRNCYSESKRMGETMCKAANSQFGIPIACIRFFHTYSPMMDLENDPRVFAQFVNNIIKKEDIVMLSDGMSERYFCYVSDAIDACCRVLLCPDEAIVCNLCNPYAKTTIINLAHTLVNLYPEKKLQVVTRKRTNREYIVSEVNHQPDIDCSFLMRLGWNPQISISEGFKRVIEYQIEAKF